MPGVLEHGGHAGKVVHFAEPVNPGIGVDPHDDLGDLPLCLPSRGPSLAVDERSQQAKRANVGDVHGAFPGEQDHSLG